MFYMGLQKMMTAALLDHEFRQLLLNNPLLAAEGNGRYYFNLSAEEMTFLGTTKPKDYWTLVADVVRWMSHQRTRLLATGYLH